MCKSKIEKTGGCNHMTCYFCGYEFCWVCRRGATEDSDHWKEYSLTGCGAPMLDSRLHRRDLDKLKSRKAGKFCLIFFCFPFIVMVEVPRFLTTIFWDQTEGCLPNWLRCPLAVLICILAIPLGVAAIPFAILYCIFYVIHQCCYVRCCKKSRNQLAAEERIRSIRAETSDDIKNETKLTKYQKQIKEDLEFDS